MQLSTMRTEARLIFGQTDSANSHFTEAQLTSWANEFYRFACAKLRSVPIKERTYTTGTTITLNSNTVTVDRAKLAEQTSGDWQELKIIDIDELYALDPDWENAATNIPTHLVRMGTFSARLYPPPNTANNSIANGLKTHGLEIPTALSDDADTPDLPAHVHDLFPHWMAYRAFSRLGNEERAKSELIIVNGLLKDIRLSATEFSNSRGWRWMGDSDEGSVVGRLQG